MNRYVVSFTETNFNTKHFVVEANSKIEAEDIILDRYKNEEFIFYPEDYVTTFDMQATKIKEEDNE